MIRNGGDLSDRQYGSRKGRSTVGAVREVTAALEAANRVRHAARPIVLLVTMDVKNCFNTARWVDILGALESFGVPPYLIRMVKDYFLQRILLYITKAGRRFRPLSGGIAQDSLEGPDFWEALIIGLFPMAVPDGLTLLGYVDHTAAIIIAPDLNTARIKNGNTDAEGRPLDGGT